MLLLGCTVTPTDEGPPRYLLARSWRYESQQAAPRSAVRAEGGVQITFQSGLRFDGAVDLMEVDFAGVSERRTGVLSGRFRDSLHVDFDVRLDAEIRRHVGAVRGDTVSGEWAEVTSPTPVTGTFRMVRAQ